MLECQNLTMSECQSLTLAQCVSLTLAQCVSLTLPQCASLTPAAGPLPEMKGNINPYDAKHAFGIPGGRVEGPNTPHHQSQRAGNPFRRR